VLLNLLWETAVYLSQFHQKFPGCLDVAVHGVVIIEGQNVEGWSKVNSEGPLLISQRGISTIEDREHSAEINIAQ